jgi:hypothetical protein
MIPITKEIIGPGIQEEYTDALSRITRLLEILRPFPEDNSTPEGRLKYELTWLKQEIEDNHLAFPVDKRLISTFLYIMTEGSLDRLPGFPEVAEALATVLLDGLVKPRHYPVVASMISEAIERVPESAIDSAVRGALRDLEEIRAGLLAGRTTLPLKKEDWPDFSRIRWTKRPQIEFPVVQAMSAIYFTLFTGARPALCDKGPLPAPRPGLRQKLKRN